MPLRRAERLGAATPSSGNLIAAKTATVIRVELLRSVSPAAIMTIPAFILLGVVAFSGLALVMAGTLRAEGYPRRANLVYILPLGVGGAVFPLTKFPVLEPLPTDALSTGLRDVLQQEVAFPVGSMVTLAVWATVAIAVAARTSPWD
jgi:ABC-2 type transport system permease protein